MAIMASWRGKKWEVSSNVIYALSSISTSFTLKTETRTTSEGKEEKIVKGIDLIPLSFETIISRSVGVDVMSEIESWKSLIGKTDKFILGGNRFLADSFMLESVSVGTVETDDKGKLISASLSFSFIEEEKKLNDVNPSSSKAGPSKKDKNTKKIINSQIISSSSTVMSI